VRQRLDALADAAARRASLDWHPSKADAAALSSSGGGGGGGTAGFWVEFRTLSRRQLRLVRRHPTLATLNIAMTALVSAMIGGAFWQMDRSDFDSVIQRIGLIFFLALYFLFTALVSLNMWQTDRLIYFQEHGAGAYGAGAYLLSKTLCDLLPMRVLPSLLCAAIVYPMAGLRASDASGPAAAALFAGALTLSNVACTVAFNCIGIAARSAAAANMLAATYSLVSLLLCGFLVTRHQLESFGEPVVGYAVFASYLYPAFELVMSNELLGQTAFIKPLKIDIEPYPIPGAEVMAHFGYETGECSRLLGEEGGCAYTLGALAGWVAGGVLLSYVLLRHCVTDPH